MESVDRARLERLGYWVGPLSALLIKIITKRCAEPREIEWLRAASLIVRLPNNNQVRCDREAEHCLRISLRLPDWYKGN